MLVYADISAETGGHTRSDTTQVCLRKLNRTSAMERVRDLDWGTPFLPDSG